ncbi:hypothetical protein [Actinotalea sp.]|uniref:hypothetical protein n=1 Tax=Actinotalea sp. TaxID=1872145 RepID=UPI00356B1105
MSWSETLVLVVAVLLLLVWSLWVVASRLDRLHRKVAGTRAVLDNQLVRRASVAAELAWSGLLDPVTSVLVGEAAWQALSAGGGEPGALLEIPEGLAGTLGVPTDAAVELDRDMAESELSRTLCAALSDEGEVAEIRQDPVGEELLATLASSWYRIQLSRRFHNEAVAQAQRMRRTVLVRLLRVAGHAPMPQTVEIDDGWPEALPPSAR